jgi:DNA polymerase III subunit epsilon
VRLRARPEGVAAAYADVGRPPGRTAWREARWCALDLELTGLDPDKDEIVAIGAVPIEHGRLILADSMYTLVRSSRRSEHDAVLMHKLRVSDLADAPPLERAAEMVMEVLAGRVPVFHTGWVETSFLAPLFSTAHLRFPAAADTELVGRLFLHFRDGIAPARLSLAGLSELLGQSGEAPHHALADALTTAQAFIALATKLEAFEPQTVASLTGAGKRLGGGRRFGPI